MKKNKIITDTVTNWFDTIPVKDRQQIKPDKNFNTHLIQPTSMIVVSGGTGSGKTNYVLEFLSRKTDAFYDIIIFSGSFAEEPLYNLLKSKIPDIQIIDDIASLPTLEDIKNIDFKERLLIFDDTVKLNPQQQSEIEKFFMAGRKKGFTVMYLTQKLLGKKGEGCPIFIRSQMNYLILFFYPNHDEVMSILRKYHMNVPIEPLLNIYNQFTKIKGNFLTFDFRKQEIRKNFIAPLI